MRSEGVFGDGVLYPRLWIQVLPSIGVRCQSKERDFDTQYGDAIADRMPSIRLRFQSGDLCMDLK